MLGSTPLGWVDPVSSWPIDRGLLHHVELDVHRYVEEDRRTPAGEGMPRRHCDVVGQPLHLPAGTRPGGDGTEEPGVVHLLKPAPEFLTEEVAAAEEQHRRLRVPGGGDPGDGIGHPGASGDRRHPEPPGEPGVRLGGVGSGLLVPDVNHSDPLLDAPVEDGDDVAAGKSEDGIDTLGSERPGDDLTAVDLGHWTRR